MLKIRVLIVGIVVVMLLAGCSNTKLEGDKLKLFSPSDFYEDGEPSEVVNYRDELTTDYLFNALYADGGIYIMYYMGEYTTGGFTANIKHVTRINESEIHVWLDSKGSSSKKITTMAFSYPGDTVVINAEKENINPDALVKVFVDKKSFDTGFDGVEIQVGQFADDGELIRSEEVDIDGIHWR